MSSKLYNSQAYFTDVRIAEFGFREYDARWVIEPLGPSQPDVQINYRGLQRLGSCLGRFLQLEENGAHETIVVGHDFRKYAENAKNALVLGLLSSGIDVQDAGLCITPMVYFAQWEYGVEACAMVTASHNPNGWTGVKMGYGKSQTFGPDRMSAFRDLVLESIHQDDETRESGRYSQRGELLDDYVENLVSGWGSRLASLPRLRVAVETGNGTGGMVLPRILRELGFDVVEGNVALDWDFPNFNPNPENMAFLGSVQELVRGSDADLGICVDGDGDRVGIIDNLGNIAFSDRVGLLIAKKIEKMEGPSRFVVDVKSTALYSRELESEVIWEKAGHSYIKHAIRREKAAAGFERSGHFFLNPPFGHGYDDACVAALFVLWIACQGKSEQKNLSDLLAAIPSSHQSPTREAKLPEARKYEIMDEIRQKIEEEVSASGKFGGVEVADVLTVNGIRVNLVDGSWLLIRASSNTPKLVIVAESFDEDGALLEELDRAARQVVAEVGEVEDFEPLYRQ